MCTRSQNRRSEPALKLFLAFVCVLLVIFTTVHVAHMHADVTATHADCTLCVAAHLTVHPAQTPAQAAVVRLVALREPSPESLLRSADAPLSLFIRPPPRSHSAA